MDGRIRETQATKRVVYQPPIMVKAGSFLATTRGLTVFDYEIRVGKKGG